MVKQLLPITEQLQMLYLVEIFLTLLMNHLQKQNLPLNLHLPPLFPPPLPFPLPHDVPLPFYEAEFEKSVLIAQRYFGFYVQSLASTSSLASRSHINKLSIYRLNVANVVQVLYYYNRIIMQICKIYASCIFSIYTMPHAAPAHKPLRYLNSA